MTLATLLALAGLSACTSSGTAPDSAAVYGYVARAASAPASDGTIAVAVCLAPRDSAHTVGSYRGELTFDTSAVDIVSVERGPAAGGMRIENARQAGRIMFAGAAPRGFKDPLVFQLRLRLRAPHVSQAPHEPRTSLPRLTLSFQELFSVTGADISALLAVSSL